MQRLSALWCYEDNTLLVAFAVSNADCQVLKVDVLILQPAHLRSSQTPVEQGLKHR